MKVFFDEECLLHDPPYEIISGKLHPYYETPKRLLRIRQALEENDVFQIEDADRSIDTKKHALQVHSEDYVEYLETAFQLWVEDGADPKVQTGFRIASMRLQLTHLRIRFSQRHLLIPSLPLTLPAVRLGISSVKRVSFHPSPAVFGLTRVWNRLLLL